MLAKFANSVCQNMQPLDLFLDLVNQASVSTEKTRQMNVKFFPNNVSKLGKNSFSNRIAFLLKDIDLDITTKISKLSLKKMFL